ncbi:hypothetical protein GUITHDRAFT_99439 [Guillardia theta CCMP2712]|uniref:Uncharacterized protein n=1 Tax=Guillardia theta (strain CCMP2712) TaxID=905079 RepID=L1K368_GUITC|nr:hypothetical protein GUITHDRAFT_99439 [Guillardia theta CCMP2712]EKX54788.1 hypothetical protein GUITHDRAFT_99439 [Guillardia theta CCMP2712]|eukprot:XP_005841768.1 hypothetical protein GUITHDRAFT_99439 [Guillardia theta CCMP2712]
MEHTVAVVFDLQEEVRLQEQMLCSLLESQELNEGTKRSPRKGALQHHLKQIGNLLRGFNQESKVEQGMDAGDSCRPVDALPRSSTVQQAIVPCSPPALLKSDHGSAQMMRVCSKEVVCSQLKPRLPGDRTRITGDETSRKEQDGDPCLALPQLYCSPSAPKLLPSPFAPLTGRVEHSVLAVKVDEVPMKRQCSSTESEVEQREADYDIRQECRGVREHEEREASESFGYQQQAWLRSIQESIREQARRSNRFDGSARGHWAAMRALLEGERDGVLRSERTRRDCFTGFVRHLSLSAARRSLLSLLQSPVPRIKSMKSLLQHYHSSSPFAFTSSVYQSCHKAHYSPSSIKLWVSMTSSLWLHAPSSEGMLRRRMRRTRLFFLRACPVADEHKRSVRMEYLAAWKDYVQDLQIHRSHRGNVHSAMARVVMTTVMKSHFHALSAYYVGTVLPHRMSFLALQTVFNRWRLRQVLHAWSCSSFTNKLLSKCDPLRQPLHKKPSAPRIPVAAPGDSLKESDRQSGSRQMSGQELTASEMEETEVRRERHKQEEQEGKTLIKSPASTDFRADSITVKALERKRVEEKKQEEDASLPWTISLVSQPPNAAMLATADGKFSRRKYRRLLLIERSGLVLLRTHLRWWRRARQWAKEITRRWTTISKHVLLTPRADPLPPLSVRLERLIKAFSAWEGCVLTSSARRGRRREEAEKFRGLAAGSTLYRRAD